MADDSTENVQQEPEDIPIYEKIPLLIIVGIVEAVLFAIRKGPFFPPFGGSRE